MSEGGEREGKERSREGPGSIILSMRSAPSNVGLTLCGESGSSSSRSAQTPSVKSVCKCFLSIYCVLSIVLGHTAVNKTEANPCFVEFAFQLEQTGRRIK